MKVLYVSDFLMLGHSGGAHLSKAHLKTLKQLYGEENVRTIAVTYAQDVTDPEYECIKSYDGHIGQLRNVLQGNTHAFNNTINKRMLSIIVEERIDVVFFDNGYFGKQCKLVKELFPSIPIITFNHGILRNGTNQQITERKFKPQYWPQIFGLLRGEKQSSKYADVILVINSRDANEFEKAYKRKADYILPAYIEEMSNVSKDESLLHEAKILFVGGNFYPNIHGIKWFSENVLPKLTCKARLTIVGRGLESLRTAPEIKGKKNIEVVGGVEDLSLWYNTANIVVGPIFYGDGMKTKTAEALQFGKIYIGTQEALCGYDMLKKYECNTADEFIKMIEGFCKEGIKFYNPEIREIFDRYYSESSAEKMMEEIFNMAGR
jgi:hypothetical protein